MSVTVCAAPGFPVGYQGSPFSCRTASSSTPGAWVNAPNRYATGATSWGVNAAQMLAASPVGTRVVGAAQVRPGPFYAASTATSFGAQSVTAPSTARKRAETGAAVPSTARQPSSTTHSTARRATWDGSAPRIHTNDIISQCYASHSTTTPKMVQPAQAVPSGGSVTLPTGNLTRRVSLSPCKPRSGSSISTTAASPQDGQMYGASVITTAYGGSTLTSAAGGSVTTNAASHWDTPSFGSSVGGVPSLSGGSIATAAARGRSCSRSRNGSKDESLGPAAVASDTKNLQALDEEEEPENMDCTVVAFKDNGMPLIWRLENKDTGKVQTIVEHDDGSVKAFGDSTIASIEKAEEAKTLKYADSLSDVDLRGFVHEVDQRLSDRFRAFNKKQRELGEMCDGLDREYFGIDKEATRNDLDKAYRRLARKMHPDKNGSTEYAKQAFQSMFDRYTRLRSKLRESVNEMDLVERYVDRVCRRACAKEDSAVRCFVDRLSAKSFRRASRREATKDIKPELAQAQAPQTESQREQPEKTSREDYNARSYLWKQVQYLIREYKMVKKNLSKIDEDLERLRRCRKH